MQLHAALAHTSPGADYSWTDENSSDVPSLHRHTIIPAHTKLPCTWDSFKNYRLILKKDKYNCFYIQSTSDVQDTFSCIKFLTKTKIMWTHWVHTFPQFHLLKLQIYGLTCIQGLKTSVKTVCTTNPNYSLLETCVRVLRSFQYPSLFKSPETQHWWQTPQKLRSIVH